jgi:hypothetical protein
MITNYPLQRIGNNINNTGAYWSAYGELTHIYSMAYDSINQDLYIGGEFDFINNYPINRIVKWNIPNNTWSSLGSGVQDGTIRSMLFSNGKLYIGGDFITVNGQSISSVAYWDTSNSTWNALSGITGTVYALAISGNILYVGGNFATLQRIAYRDISNPSSVWTTLGGGIQNNNVYTIYISGNLIYIGGNFTTVNNVSMNRITVWNNTSSTYSNIGLDVNNTIYKITEDSSFVYIVGSFTNATDSVSTKTVYGAAKWNKNTSLWSAIIDTYGINMIQSGLSVNDIIVDGDNVYFFGYFEYANNYMSKAFVSYNQVTKQFSSYYGNLYSNPYTYGASFTRIEPPQIYAMCKVNNTIYVGGVFDVLQSPDLSSDIDSNLGNLAQILINYNIDNYSPSYPSSQNPIVNFNN